MFEVRDDDDEEIKQFTHEKDIIEVIVQKENHIQIMEVKLCKVMNRILAFLKEMGLFNHSMQAKFLNKMQLLELQENFKKNLSQYTSQIIACVY